MLRSLVVLCLVTLSSLAISDELERYKFADIHGMSFGTKLVIDAPLDQVWHTLTDIQSYPEWNPLRRLSKPRLQSALLFL
jgi:hypothetical protein